MFYAGKCRCSGCFSYFIQSLSRIVLKNVIFCGISYTESGGVHVPGGKTANNFYAFCRSARHPRICYFAEAAPLLGACPTGRRSAVCPASIRPIKEADEVRGTGRSGSFLFCLLINMLLNPEWIIPAAILLALHFLPGWSVWWAVLALGAWIIGIILWMCFIGWAGRCGNVPDPPKENRNPYSSGKYPANGRDSGETAG